MSSVSDKPWSYQLSVLKTQYFWICGMKSVPKDVITSKLVDILMKFAEIYHKYGLRQEFIDESQDLYDNLQKMLHLDAFGRPASFPPLKRL